MRLVKKNKKNTFNFYLYPTRVISVQNENADEMTAKPTRGARWFTSMVLTPGMSEQHTFNTIGKIRIICYKFD